MKTQEIPEKEWTEFFDNFSRKHEGSLINLEIMVVFVYRCSPQKS